MRLTEGQKAACRDAAEYISTNGHHKGAFYDFKAVEEHLGPDNLDNHKLVATSETINPPACLLGAIAKVTKAKCVNDVQLEYQDLFKEGTVSSVPVQIWQDQPSVSAEDVILLLKKYGNS